MKGIRIIDIANTDKKLRMYLGEIDDKKLNGNSFDEEAFLKLIKEMVGGDRCERYKSY